MKSKTTISRENKLENLRNIIYKILYILINAKKSELIFINAYEIKEVARKVDAWYKAIKDIKKGSIE